MFLKARPLRKRQSCLHIFFRIKRLPQIVGNSSPMNNTKQHHKMIKNEMNKTFSPTKERTIALIIIFLFRNGAIC